MYRRLSFILLLLFVIWDFLYTLSKFDTFDFVLLLFKRIAIYAIWWWWWWWCRIQWSFIRMMMMMTILVRILFNSIQFERDYCHFFFFLELANESGHLFLLLHDMMQVSKTNKKNSWLIQLFLSILQTTTTTMKKWKKRRKFNLKIIGPLFNLDWFYSHNIHELFISFHFNREFSMEHYWRKQDNFFY